MFSKVLVASRGAVEARVLQALHQMGIPSVAVYSEAGAGALYLELATETYTIGAAVARESNIDQDKIFHVIENSHVDGPIPGTAFCQRTQASRIASPALARVLSTHHRSGSM